MRGFGPLFKYVETDVRHNMAKHKKKAISLLLGAVMVLLAVGGMMVFWDGPQEPVQEQEDAPGSSETSMGINVDIIKAEQLWLEIRSVENVRKAVGTGVVYDVTEDGVWIATAAHVTDARDKGDEIRVTVEDKQFCCTEYYPAKDEDLAFVYLSITDLSREDAGIFQEICTDKSTYDMLAAEEIVTAKGYQAGEPVEYLGTLLEPWIYVEDFEQYMILAQCEVHQGMSGGGLYDSLGNFIGMICGGNEEGELVAVPWHVMQARFEEICGED